MALDRIAELEHTPVGALKKISELERKLAKALKKISELERKLAQHDNAHTPVVEKRPSARRQNHNMESRSKTATAKVARQNRAEGRRDTREPRTGLPQRALRGTRQTGVPGAACQILQ